MPTLFSPRGGALAGADGPVTTGPQPLSTATGIRVSQPLLIIDTGGSGNGINIPLIKSVGFNENDTGQLQILSFSNLGQAGNIPDGTPAGAVMAVGQVRQAHPAIVYNLDSTDPWTGTVTPGTGTPAFIVERVDQLMVYDQNTTGGPREINDPAAGGVNLDTDGAYQGGGQVSVYAVDNYDGEVPGAALSIGATPDVAIYDSIDSSTTPPDFSKAGGQGGVHDTCHVVRIYGGQIQTNDDGSYQLNDDGSAALMLDPGVWADVQYIDVLDVIDDDGQERFWTLTQNPTQDNYPYPGS